MAIKDRKITEASIAKHGVSAAPDRMTGTAAENKKVFDNLVRNVVAEQLNGLVDDLAGSGGAGEIGVSPVSGLDGDNVQTVLTALGNKLERRIAEAGVASFNGRSGAVLPQSGDYTAAMVGAAPSGYGYGENISFIVWDDADGSKLAAYIDSFAEEGVNKVLRFTTMVDSPACVVAGAGGCADAFLNGTNNAVIVFHGATNSGNGYGCAIRKKGGGVWYPWEYVNPPMQLGGYDAETDTHTNEYRTTERYQGKPVYAKLVNCGALPNATSKLVRYGGNECRPVGLMYGYSTSNYRSYHLGTNPDGTVIGFSHYNISIQTTTDLSTTGVFIAVKYIKTTD